MPTTRFFRKNYLETCKKLAKLLLKTRIYVETRLFTRKNMLYYWVLLGKDTHSIRIRRRQTTSLRQYSNPLLCLVKLKRLSGKERLTSLYYLRPNLSNYPWPLYNRSRTQSKYDRLVAGFSESE
jgi:hypothetical protein